MSEMPRLMVSYVRGTTTRKQRAANKKRSARAQKGAVQLSAFRDSPKAVSGRVIVYSERGESYPVEVKCAAESIDGEC